MSTWEELIAEPTFMKCVISASGSLAAPGVDPQEIKEDSVFPIMRSVMIENIKKELLNRRPKSDRMMAAAIGFAMLTVEEKEELDRRLDVFESGNTNKARQFCRAITNEAMGKLTPELSALSEGGIMVQEFRLEIESKAPLFDLGGFERALKGMTLLGRLKGMARSMLGIEVRPSRPEPYIDLQMSVRLHGLRDDLDKAAAVIADIFRPMGITIISEFMMSEYTPRAPKHEPAAEPAAERVPIPVAGFELFRLLRNIGSAIKAENKNTALDLANKLSSLVAGTPEICRLLRPNPAISHDRQNPNFAGGSDRAVGSNFARTIVSIIQHGAMDALCDLMFEVLSSRRGLLNHIAATVDNTPGVRGSEKFYGDAIRTVFGSRENARELIGDFFRNQYRAMPKRIREIDDRNNAAYAAALHQREIEQAATRSSTPDQSEPPQTIEIKP